MLHKIVVILSVGLLLLVSPLKRMSGGLRQCTTSTHSRFTSLATDSSLRAWLDTGSAQVTPVRGDPSVDANVSQRIIRRNLRS